MGKKVLISRCRRRRPPPPDWASLPSEIVDLILSHLIQLVDYVRFAAVCKSWLSAALHQKDLRRRRTGRYQSVPMLLTPPIPATKLKAGDPHHLLRWRLYSVTGGGKLLNWDGLRMRPPHSQRLCGSSYGWLGAVNEDWSLTFFNPFSGKNVHFPPPSPRPPQIIIRPPDSATWVDYTPFDKPVLKFVCSSDPYNFASFSGGDFVIGTIFGKHDDFAYIKPGYYKEGSGWTYVNGSYYKEGSGSGWTYINGRSGSTRGGFKDAVYHLGKFYLVDKYCCVISVDVSTGGGTGSSNTATEAKPPHVEVVVPPTDYYTYRVYLVVSSGGGDLLVVQAVPHPTRLQTTGFKIFKLLGLDNADHNQKFAELVEINDLGNDTLFLGDNHSLCVSALNGGCRPNCIYYVRDCQDTNVYSLEDRSFSPLKGVKTRLKRAGHPPPIWIVPTLM